MSEKFFTSYEQVRYGRTAVIARDAAHFIKEIGNLIEKNFTKEV